MSDTHTTKSTSTGLPVAEIPIGGFHRRSDEAKKGVFRDETVQEREAFLQQHGYYPNTCDMEHPAGGYGMCTRPANHQGHGGMHQAGQGKFLVGAW